LDDAHQDYPDESFFKPSTLQGAACLHEPGANPAEPSQVFS
jgi:hypothetical protein